FKAKIASKNQKFGRLEAPSPARVGMRLRSRPLLNGRPGSRVRSSNFGNGSPPWASGFIEKYSIKKANLCPRHLGHQLQALDLDVIGFENLDRGGIVPRREGGFPAENPSQLAVRGHHHGISIIRS